MNEFCIATISQHQLAPHLSMSLRLLVLSSLRRRLLATPRSSSLIDAMNVRLPLLDIRSQDTTIVGQETVDLTLHVRGLRVHGAAAGEALGLLADVAHEDHGAVVVGLEVGVELVRLVDGVDGLLDVPEAGGRGQYGEEWGREKSRLDLLLDGDVVANAAVLAGDTDALGVVGSLRAGLEGGAALGMCVVVVVLGACQH